MAGITDPATYDAWYRTEKGQWIGDTEFALLMKLLHPIANQSLLDVGCGTGYFTQRFNDADLRVCGVDPNSAMLQYAQSKNKEIEYLQANAYDLPFDDVSFDYCTAITSLCFMKSPQIALAEMWRVSRKGVVLGLLNRYSLLHVLKQNSPGYKGARWDTPATIHHWLQNLTPTPDTTIRSAVWIPLDSNISRWLEPVIPTHLKYGGFLAISLMK
jgi:ubiquinone/menaquinone biosynthesis C-methylase UbiE